MKKTEIEQFCKSAPVGAELWDKGLNDSIAGLHLRKNTAKIVWRYRYRSKDGKRHYERLGDYPALTADAARSACKLLMAKLAHGTDPIKERLEAKRETTNTARHYLDSVYKLTLATKKTGREIEQVFYRYFSDNWLDAPMKQLSARDVTKWQAGMIEQGYAFGTQEKAYKGFQTLLNHAVKHGYLELNPIKAIALDNIHQSPEKAQELKERRTYLTKEQVKQLMLGLDLYQERKREQRRNSRKHGKPWLDDYDAVEFVDYVKPAILTMFYMGLRNGDVYGLRWEDVSLNQFSPVINKVLEKTAHKVKQAKTLPIAPPLAETLKAWHTQQGEPKRGYVFANSTGGRLGSKALNKPWERVKELAGLPSELDLYSLRHNFASWLVMNGTDLLTVASLMGHSDIEMIKAHYGHLSPEHQESAVVNSFAKMFESEEFGKVKKITEAK